MGLEISPDLLLHVTARHGRLLVERLDPGALARHIVIPDQYRKSRVSASAIIRRVGEGCPEWAIEGAQLILAAAHSNKKLYLGSRNEVVWESIPPSWVQAVICAKEGRDEVSAEREPEHTFRDIAPADRVITDEVINEEGA